MGIARLGLGGHGRRQNEDAHHRVPEGRPHQRAEGGGVRVRQDVTAEPLPLDGHLGEIALPLFGFVGILVFLVFLVFGFFWYTSIHFFPTGINI